MKKTIALFILLFICFQNVKSTDTSAVKYFPLKAGNMYKFRWFHYMGIYDSIYCQITKDTMINGKKYFYCYNYPVTGTGWVRFDTASGNLYKYTAGCPWHPAEALIDSLSASVGNKINLCDLADTSKHCISDSSFTLFGIITKRKVFETYQGGYPGYSNQDQYAKNFGLYYTGGASGSYFSDVWLIGCIINGISYGNTIGLTEINNFSNNIITKYQLYQNYPDPFNPFTKIKYDLPKDSKVTIVIYDLLGKQINKLVNNEFQKAGTYSITFNGSSLASGVYFYRLVSDKYVEVKKMVLIK
jgi:hypothetical protein